MSFRVNQFSIPRSGSTFTQQIWWHLAGKENVYTWHVPRQEVNVIVYRDFIDAFMSYYRVQSDQSDYFIDDTAVVDEYLYGSGAKDGAYIYYIRNLFWYANKINYPSPKLILEYDTDIITDEGMNRYEHLITKMCRHFKIETSIRQINEIAQYCDINVNRRRSEEQGSWHNVNREHNIHGRHVYDGRPGAWGQHCSIEVQKYLLDSELNKRYRQWQKLVGK